MSNHTFFTSDLHIGHQNILKFESEVRQSETLEEMHERMIERWNDVVRSPKNDLVYIVGDVVMGGKKWLPVLDRLNGRKVLIGGNHDHFKVEDYAPYIERILGAKEKFGAIITHIPVHPSQFNRYFANIHGHLHSKFVTDADGSIDRRYINVCMDAHDMIPVSLEWVKEQVKIARELQKN